MEEDNYYAILKINPSASMQEIKRAYHKQAKKYHPDKHSVNVEEASIKFQKIENAYATLSDMKKRDSYNLLTSMNIKTAAYGQKTYSDVFSSLLKVMERIHEKSREADKRLSDMFAAMNRPISTYPDDSSSSSSYDEEKALAWLREEEFLPEKRKKRAK